MKLHRDTMQTVRAAEILLGCCSKHWSVVVRSLWLRTLYHLLDSTAQKLSCNIGPVRQVSSSVYQSVLLSRCYPVYICCWSIEFECQIWADMFSQYWVLARLLIFEARAMNEWLSQLSGSVAPGARCHCQWWICNWVIQALDQATASSSFWDWLYNVLSVFLLWSRDKSLTP